MAIYWIGFLAFVVLMLMLDLGVFHKKDHVLRSLYFALNGVMRYFYYLKYALAGILTFIGFKMCINELNVEFGYLFKITNWVSLSVIVGMLSISIIFSIIVKIKKRETIKQLIK